MKVNILNSLIILSLMFLSVNLSAQHRKEISPERKAEMQALKKELKSYADNTIKPLITEQRNKLDTYLSKSEQKEIASIREKTKAQKIASRAFRKELRESGAGRGEMSEEQIAKSRQLRKTQRQLHTQAWAIVDAHEDEINTLLDELKPQIEVWRKDMREIKSKHMPEGSRNRGDWNKMGSAPTKGEMKRGGHRGKGGAGFRPGRGGMGNISSLRNPVAFLLHTPDSSLPFEDAAPELSVFPNPTSAPNSLKFELTESGPVQINLLDSQGNVLKSLINEEMQAGSHLKKFDLGELEDGVYIYQIKTTTGISTKKLIIEK
ncbi:MAG: T9SS type A sorting domain-containing protein [Bacteroidota bacterium]